MKVLSAKAYRSEMIRKGEPILRINTGGLISFNKTMAIKLGFDIESKELAVIVVKDDDGSYLIANGKGVGNAFQTRSSGNSKQWMFNSSKLVEEMKVKYDLTLGRKKPDGTIIKSVRLDVADEPIIWNEHKLYKIS